MNTVITKLGLLLGLALAVSACAETPAELTSARVAISHASGGEAAAEAPSELERARAAVREADQCVERGCDAEVVRDLAYVASRRVQRAEAEARIAEEVRLQQDAYRRHQDSATRQRLPAPPSGGVAQSGTGAPAPVMVR